MTLNEPTHLCFNSNIGRQKPESILNRQTACPFCDRPNLTSILAEEWPMLLLVNKYPVLEDTFPTVLIETDDCDGELSMYPKDHLHRLIRFGIHHWQSLKATGDYRSILFFKNHGPYSGGTIHHPHMQIVGLKKMNYRDHVRAEHFSGIEIAKVGGVELNVSNKPRIGFFEFNVILEGGTSNGASMDTFADFIQIAAHYTLNHFNKSCHSYNLFFYEFQGKIICKIMPRFITSPVFIGYSIPQVSNRIDDVALDIQNRYFSNA